MLNLLIIQWLLLTILKLPSNYCQFIIELTFYLLFNYLGGFYSYLWIGANCLFLFCLMEKKKNRRFILKKIDLK